jgi:outer membrane lipoprotein-sorting protein
MIKSKRFLMGFLIAFFFINVFGFGNTDTQAKKIVKKIDELYRSRTSYAKIEMAIKTPHWKRTLRMVVWTEGMEKTFIRILSPKKDKNTATLKIGNQMWNYLPKVNKIIKIPPSMMMSSWMGSDFTNDDLVKEYTFLDDYDFKIVDNKGEKDKIFVLCIPKEGVAIVWSKILLAVNKDNYIPVWEKYYDDRGDIVRKMSFGDIKKIGNKLVPMMMEMIPLKKKGHKTIIRYLELKYNIKLKSSVFSLRNLRNIK